MNNSFPFVFLLGSLFGAHLVVSRFSVGQFSPSSFVALRLAIASLCHLLVYLLIKKRHFPTDKKLIFHASVMGTLGLALPMMSMVTALQYVSSGVVSLLQTVLPAITALFGQLFLDDETLTLKKISGIVIAFGGAALLILNRETGIADLHRADWRGYIWAMIALVGIAASLVYARKYMKSMDNFDAASVRMISGAIFCLPFAWIISGYDFSRVQPSGYLALGFAAIFATFFVFILEIYIIKRFGATESAKRTYIVPIVATILGAIFLGEIVTPIMIVGMAFIFLGLALIGKI